MKGPSRKHILFPVFNTNKNLILHTANMHVDSMNRRLKSIKSDVSVNCIHPTWNTITLITNKVARASYLTVIEKYIQNIENINREDDMNPELPQSKSHLKILDMPYYGNNLSKFISVIHLGLIWQ